MADIVLTSGPLGGLGDLLLYTSLPERYAKQGHDVYLDRDNVCRNDDIYDLLWAHNPYIKGTSDKKPNAGYVNQGKFYDCANQFPIGSIEAMERVHGFEPPYSLAPKLYYAPQPFHTDLKECVLVDFSALSSAIAPAGMREHLDKMALRFNGRQFYMITFPDGVVKEKVPISGPSIGVNSLFEYVDALASCYAFVGSEAGGQALAAAVRGEHEVHDLAARPHVISVISPKTFNSRGYTFRGVDYRVTVHGNVSSDYWDPHEVNYERYQIMCRRSVEDARSMYAAAKLLRQNADAQSA